MEPDCSIFSLLSFINTICKETKALAVRDRFLVFREIIASFTGFAELVLATFGMHILIILLYI